MQNAGTEIASQTDPETKEKFNTAILLDYNRIS